MIAGPGVGPANGEQCSMSIPNEKTNWIDQRFWPKGDLMEEVQLKRSNRGDPIEEVQ